MNFEDFKEQAVNHLEAADSPYSSELDDVLWALWRQGLRPDQVIAAMSISTT